MTDINPVLLADKLLWHTEQMLALSFWVLPVCFTTLLFQPCLMNADVLDKENVNEPNEVLTDMTIKLCHDQNQFW